MIRFAKREFDTPGNYKIFYKQNTKDVDIHWHNYYEFDIILSGSGTTYCNGIEYKIERGLITFVSPIDFHDLKNMESVDIINIQFPEDDIDASLLNTFLSLKTNVVHADEQTLKNIENLSALLGTHPDGKYVSDYNKKIIECIIIQFLSCCKDDTSSAKEPSTIQQALVYLKSHFKENPSMQSISEMLYLNPSYFCRLFKNQTGMSYKNYLKKLKLEYSMTLIKYTDLSILDIATNSGYETQTHFNREFKEYYNAAPSYFRKNSTDM